MPNAFQFRSFLGLGQPQEDDSAAQIAHDYGERPEDSSDLHTSQSRTNRSLQVRENLDVLMRQIEHARHDADQMMDEMSALEVTAGQATTLRRENDILREKLDDSARETMTEAAKADSASREISRLKDELGRIREDCEKSQREASANALDTQRLDDRLRTTVAALEETKRDLASQREAKDKAEVDAASLRSNLAERDRTHGALIQQETELRMQVAKLQTQNEDVVDALARRERSVIEKTSELEITRDRIAELENEADASRDELRVLGNKYSDLKVSQDARIYSLNDGLEQERESHRMTRKLLEEARSINDAMSDELGGFKDQAMASTKESDKLKRELNAVRTQIHEYGEKLKESHLRNSAAQGDIQRLEVALEDAKKDAVTLRRQANKSDQLLRENTDLHDKVASMQQSLDRYRGRELLDDVPIMLSNSQRSASSPPKKSKAASALSGGQNVARIARR